MTYNVVMRHSQSSGILRVAQIAFFIFHGLLRDLCASAVNLEFSGLVCLILAVSRTANGQSTGNVPIAWPAIDGLGRPIPTAKEVGPPKDDRWVGIFYFLTHNSHVPGAEVHDISKILAADPQALMHADSTAWGAPGGEYYWGEPLYGYYLSTDPWVIRRHAELLSLAGVDTLIFDTTNVETYPKTYSKICEVFTEMRRTGEQTPRICFMVNTQAGKTADRLYHDLYEPARFKELWFQWRGKPLLICDPKEASENVKTFFTLRAAHWPFTLVNTHNGWHWESTYPQVYSYDDVPAKPEEVNVAVAQNLRAGDGRVTNMSEGNARGRSFHDGREDHSPGAIDHGYNFAEQWKRALDLNPPFVMVTGWNEWTAGRFGNGTPFKFVDQFDEEFSRDIEPMHGGHADNYYYQLVANIRRYKGAQPIPPASAPKTIDIAGSFDQWKEVGPEYAGSRDDARPRDDDGAAGLHYSNTTARNCFATMKVARDAKNVYFYAAAHKPLTPATDPNWMQLLLRTGGDQPTWEGYDFILNREPGDKNSAWLEQSQGGWNWKRIAKIAMRAEGNELQLAIPRELLGLPETHKGFSIEFKWADNLRHAGVIMDFYTSGDVAPAGRFRFRYEGQ